VLLDPQNITEQKTTAGFIIAFLSPAENQEYFWGANIASIIYLEKVLLIVKNVMSDIPFIRNIVLRAVRPLIIKKF